MFKEIKAAQNVLGLLTELQKLDTDGDGVADIKEYADCAKEVIPEVLLAKEQAEALQATVGRIKDKLGDKYDLFMGNLAYVQAKLGS